MGFQSWLQRYWNSFSFVGLIFAGFFFAVSLSPSLLPRIYIVQGLLSGIALGLGYGLGVLLVWLYEYLELPQPSGRFQQMVKWLAVISVAVVLIVFLWRMTVWQNSIRMLMEMEPLATTYPWRVALIAVVFGALLIAGITFALGLFSWQLALVLALLCNANEIHKWAHRTKKENGPRRPVSIVQPK